MMRRVGSLILALAASAWAMPALAGPPYVTDDPAPMDLGHWEIHAFTSGSHVKGLTEGASGLDLNYGAAKDLQLTLVLPLAWEDADSFQARAGDVEMATKYQFLHQDGVGVDLAFFPRAFLPTGPRRGEPKHVNLLLPVWIGRQMGDWNVFGGGGYEFNPGPGNKDFWQGGIAVTRQIGERLSLGGEIYHRTADVDGGHHFSGVNLGVAFKLNEHYSLLASGGPGIQNANEGGLYDFYVSLKADY